MNKASHVGNEAFPVVDEACPVLNKASHVGKEAFPAVHEAFPVVNKAPDVGNKALLLGIEACPAGSEGAEGETKRIPPCRFRGPPIDQIVESGLERRLRTKKPVQRRYDDASDGPGQSR